MENVKGIFAALVTPFNENNEINDMALEKIIEMNIEKGIDGFYVGGSTGEVFLLSFEERKHILDVVCGVAKGKCKIISHIGCTSTDMAIELGKYAEKKKVDAISALPPTYYKFSFDEVFGYYNDISKSIDLPLLIYNFPAFSGVNLSIGQFKMLLENPKIAGLKNSTFDLFLLERLKNSFPDKVMLNGHDEVFLSSLIAGADGAIGSTFNIMVEKFLKIRSLYKEGMLDEAKTVQSEANKVVELLIDMGIIPGIKEILNCMNIKCGYCRKPFSKVDVSKHKNSIKTIMELLE